MAKKYKVYTRPRGTAKKKCSEKLKAKGQYPPKYKVYTRPRKKKA